MPRLCTRQALVVFSQVRSARPPFEASRSKAPFLRRASCTKKALRPDSGAMPKRSPMLPVSPGTPPNSNTQERWRRLQTSWGFHHAATVPSVIKDSQHTDLTADIPCVGANPLRPLTHRVRPIIVQRGPTYSLGMTLSRAKDSGARSGHCNGAVDDERPVGVPGPMGQWLHPNKRHRSHGLSRF